MKSIAYRWHKLPIFLPMFLPALLVATVVAVGGLIARPSVAHAQEAQWVNNFASGQEIVVNATDVSLNNEVFVAGIFHGTVDFDFGPGEKLLSSGGSDTAFIAKYDALGNLVWAYRLAGSGDVVINDIVVDSMFQVGVVGSFEGTVDLDPGEGTFYATSKGRHDIFLLRLLTDGNLQWAWTAGDGEDDMGFAIETDSRSGLYIAGKYEGRIFFQAGESPSYEWRSVGGSDAFAARFNNAGTLDWVRVWGGDEDDLASDLDLAANNKVVVVGTFAAVADLDPLWTATESRSRGRDDIFITIMSGAGVSLWQWQMGGTGNERNAKVFVEEDGSFYVSGEFENRGYFNMLDENVVVDSRGQHDIFVARFGPGVRAFQWAYGMGGANSDTLAALAQDIFGNLYVLGTFSGSANFGLAAIGDEVTSSGGTDIFLAQYTHDGQLRRVQNMINAQDDRASTLRINYLGNVLVGGEYRGTIDLGSGLSASTGRDDNLPNAFVAQYARDVWTPLPGRSYLPGIIASPTGE